jgi:hypothetical protein
MAPSKGVRLHVVLYVLLFCFTGVRSHRKLLAEVLCSALTACEGLKPLHCPCDECLRQWVSWVEWRQNGSQENVRGLFESINGA